MCGLGAELDAAQVDVWIQEACVDDLLEEEG